MKDPSSGPGRGAEMVHRDDAVIPYVLRRHAQSDPHRVCVRFEDRSEWDWAEALQQCGQAAHVLQAAGVRRGDRVGVLLPNGPDFLRAWWGSAQTGAVLVPLHTAARGEQLAQLCSDAGVSTVVSDRRFEPVLRKGGLHTTTIWELAAATVAPFPDPPIESWETHSVNFTSGTTGPPKGAEARWVQAYLAGRDVFGSAAELTPEDRWLVDLPLHHVAAQQIVLTALSVGASIAVRTQFTGTQYWQVASDCGVTHSLLAGSMAALLSAAPPGPDDRSHGLRVVVSSPMVADPADFIQRFGLLDMVTAFGGTETGTPMVGTVSQGLPRGSVGRARGLMEARIVNEHDIEVPTDQTGELLVRSGTAWEISTRYVGQPGPTAKAWRNGWFHTGDVFRRDTEGWFYFVERMHDAIRRRGENVSGAEVERRALEHPAVADAACVGIPTDLGDQDVKLFVVPVEGASFSYPELFEFLADRLPYFMVPRYLEKIDDFPRTATQKVRKVELRRMAAGPACWDCEAVGLRPTRNGVVRQPV